MEITFFRSSSLNQWYYCQQSYYINYVLGHPQSTNAKTEKGTVVHKVLEVLAGMKMNLDNTGKCFYEDEHLGLVKCTKKDWMAETTLTDEEVDKLNKSMINKDTYMDQRRVPYGQKRYGVKVVNDIIRKSYDFYSSRSEHTWGNIEWRDCFNFTWIALDWDNGAFDPRKRTIVCPEKAFNFVIEEEWAKVNGEYLGIKGTIDLTTKIDDDTIEIIDWKTGQRKDWGTGEIKDYDLLCKDKQLMLYYYAAKKAFPQYKNVIISIFFIRNGGPFTLCFDDSTEIKIKSVLAHTKRQIENTELPKLLDPSHQDFRCKRLCSYFKTKVDGTPFCDYIHNSIKTYGIDATTLKNRKEGFTIGHYQAPGE